VVDREPFPRRLRATLVGFVSRDLVPGKEIYTAWKYAGLLPPSNYFRNALRLNLKTSVSTIPNHSKFTNEQRAANRAWESPLWLLTNGPFFSVFKMSVGCNGILAGPKAVFDSESNESLQVQFHSGWLDVLLSTDPHSPLTPIHRRDRDPLPWSAYFL
jgi:hypothetical protein